MAQAQQGKETGDRHTWWFAFASVLFVHSDSGEGGSSGRMPEIYELPGRRKGGDVKLSIQNRRGAIVHWLYVLSSEVIESGLGAAR